MGTLSRNSIMSENEVITKEFFLGFVKMHVLYQAGKEEVYGVALMEELSRHGYKIGPGTMYPLLHRLEKSDYLRCTKKNVDGRMRKYYRLTRKGSNLLRESKKKISELVQEVMLDQK